MTGPGVEWSYPRAGNVGLEVDRVHQRGQPVDVRDVDVGAAFDKILDRVQRITPASANEGSLAVNIPLIYGSAGRDQFLTQPHSIVLCGDHKGRIPELILNVDVRVALEQEVDHTPAVFLAFCVTHRKREDKVSDRAD